MDRVDVLPAHGADDGSVRFYVHILVKCPEIWKDERGGGGRELFYQIDFLNQYFPLQPQMEGDVCWINVFFSLPLRGVLGPTACNILAKN